WWREVFSSEGWRSDTVERLLDPTSGPYVLPILGATEQRRAVVESILRRVGSALNLPSAESSPQFDAQLAALSWGGQPLFLLMAGLLAARSNLATVLALSATDLAQKIARHEIARIERFAPSAAANPLLAHLAAYVTL